MEKRAVTYIVIGILLVLAVLLIPTKSIEYTEAVTKTTLNKPVKLTVQEAVNEPYRFSDLVNFRFQTTVTPSPSVSGDGTEWVLWEINIKNYENASGCWEYKYQVFKNNVNFDEGVLKNLCITKFGNKTFTTPMYDMGRVSEAGKVSYAMSLTPSKTPQRNMTILGNHTTLKEVEKLVLQNVTETLNETKIRRVNWLFGFTVFISTKENSTNPA